MGFSFLSPYGILNSPEMNLRAWADGYNQGERQQEPEKADNLLDGLKNLPKAFIEGSKELADDLADDTVEKIPGWDDSKGIKDNFVGGTSDNVKVITDAFGNFAKTVEELGTSAFGSVKKYAPLVLAGGLALLLLKK